MALSILLLHFHFLSWTGRNSNEKMTYSWAVDLDTDGKGKCERKYDWAGTAPIFGSSLLRWANV